MAMFLIIENKDRIALEVKGKIDPETKGLVSFSLQPIDIGFYSYTIAARANNYSQIIIDGTYVVQAQN